MRDYVDNAVNHDFDLGKVQFLILTENFVEKKEYSSILEEAGVDGDVMNETDREQMLNDMNLARFKNLFPKRSHAETSFGLFYMWFQGHSTGFLIDDDTAPQPSCDYFQTHLNSISYKGPILSLASSSRWVNVLHYSFPRYHLYPRGFPYSATHESLTKQMVAANGFDISQGLWTDIPDLDAIRILIDGDLNGQSKTRFRVEDYGENFTVAAGNYLTLCSMNLCFRRRIIPGFYQFPMDDNPWKIGRFDDIWSGVVIKKLLDSIGERIITGNPLCKHAKAPRSTFKDLNTEAPGLEANETFYLSVDRAGALTGDFVDKSAAIARSLANDSNDFIRYCGRLFLKWTELMNAF